MGQLNQTSMVETVSAMKNERLINSDQAVKFIQDYLSNSQKVQDVKNYVKEDQLVLFLKHFILNHYKESLEENSQSTERNMKNSTIKSLYSDTLKYLTNRRYKNNLKFKDLMQKICQITISKKFHKIRNISKEILMKLFDIDNFSCYLWKNQDKIQYYNSKIGFQTQILKSDNHYDFLYTQFKKIQNQSSLKMQVIQPNLNNQFSKIFINQSINISNNNNLVGLVINSNNHQALLLLDFKYTNSECLSSIISNISPFQQLQNKILSLCNSIIDLFMFLNSEYDNFQKVKIFTQKIIHLLEISILIEKRIFQQKILEIINIIKQPEVEILRIQQFNLEKGINEIFKNNKEQKQSKVKKNKLIKAIQQYKQAIIQMQNKIKLYYQNIHKQNSIFIQFNNICELVFAFSSIRKSQIMLKIQKQWQSGHKKIGDLFENYQKLTNNILLSQKNKLKGLNKQIIKNIDDNIQTQFYINQDGSLKGIYINVHQVDYKSSKSLQFSQQSHSSNTLSQSSKLNMMKRQSNDSQRFIKKLQNQNPGIMQEGWIGLFLKNNDTVRKSNRIRHKTHKTENTKRVFQSPKLFTSIQGIPLGLQQVNIQSTEINLLDFQQEKLEPFVVKIFCKLDFFRNLPQLKQQFQNFLSQIHDLYETHQNPFHNFIHGVNGMTFCIVVMHCSYLLSTIPKNKDIFSSLQLFAIVFSGLCHDVGHTGFTNAFEVASRSPKAQLYNDISPLENYHASTTFQTLKKSENNFLKSLSIKQMDELRKNVISNILFTDIKEHFPLLKKFESKLQTINNEIQIQDRKILSAMIVHTSDFCGSSKEFVICRQWAERVNIQFSNQYKMEGQLGLPQTPFMKNLNNIQVLSKNQAGFLRVIVHPLFKVINQFYLNHPKTTRMLNNIDKNIQMWEKIQKQSAIEKIVEVNEENQQEQKIGKQK